MSTPPDPAKPLHFGMLLFPGITLLDLAGPQTAFGIHGKTHLIWKTMDPVPTDSGISMNPTMTFADVPPDLDVLFVPGGFGTADMMRDEEVLSFLARAGSTARYITSVCTGSLILGMAGLLDGYRAATHWSCYGALEEMGVEGSHERVCIDRNRISGGGVTAGVDFGLTVIAQLKNQAAAELTQLALEYDPKPPFDSGHPRSAKPEIIAMAQNDLADVIRTYMEVARSYRQSSSSTGTRRGAEAAAVTGASPGAGEAAPT